MSKTIKIREKISPHEWPVVASELKVLLASTQEGKKINRVNEKIATRVSRLAIILRAELAENAPDYRSEWPGHLHSIASKRFVAAGKGEEAQSEDIYSRTWFNQGMRPEPRFWGRTSSEEPLRRERAKVDEMISELSELFPDFSEIKRLKIRTYEYQ